MERADTSSQEGGYLCGPWQAGSLVQTSSKRLKEKEKAAAPVAKFV